jgi:AcrR family transcriptional regulator
VVARAGVSESAFRAIFPNVEECYRAAFRDGLQRLSHAVTDASERERSWFERVRAGLVALLGFFDDESSWARVLVLEEPLNGALALESRQQLHDLLTRLLDGGSEIGEGTESATPSAALTGELVAGGVFSVIRSSMLEGDGSKLVELTPSLMAFITASYLGQGAAWGEPEGRPCAKAEKVVSEAERAKSQAISRAAELPIRATRRTTLVLRAIAQTPYLNNREVAQAAGLTDEGQTSKLLARLEWRGVIENVGVGAARGEPNAWLLTESGRRAVELLAEDFAGDTPRSRARMKGMA